MRPIDADGLREELLEWRKFLKPLPETPREEVEALRTVRFAIDMAIVYVDKAPTLGQIGGKNEINEAMGE